MFEVAIPAVCHLLILRAFVHPVLNMNFHLRRCCAWGCKNKLDLCLWWYQGSLWRSSGATWSLLTVNKPSMGAFPCELFGCLALSKYCGDPLFEPVQTIWPSRLFCTQIWPQTCNQTAPNKTLTPHFAGESLNYLAYCFIWACVSVCWLYCENALCW